MTNFRRVARVVSPTIERQLTEHDCAVWAIKAMCFRMNVSVPPANLVRQHLELDNVGTSVRGIRDALDEFGISAQPVQGPYDAIASAPLPAIAMIRLGPLTFHYIVVLEADHRTVRYLDPAMGGTSLSMNIQHFAAVFTGNLVLCTRKPNYVAVDLGKEVKPGKFILDAMVHEWNAAISLAIGEIFQLTMLLIGILMLKNFFSSSILGVPNFWFLGGILVCAAIYIWIGKLREMIRADVKSRSTLSLFNFATSLLKRSDVDPKKGYRETAARCVRGVSAVAASLANNIGLPGNTLSLVFYISFVAWFDFYAAWYAIAIAIVLPVVGLLQSKRNRFARKKVARTKDLNQIGLVYLMADASREEDVLSDLPWNQLGYCDAVAKHDSCVSSEAMLSMAIGRINVFAGLLIGGLQHATYGMGHTIIVFFLLSVYTSVVCRWARQVASVPESRFQVRSLLDFLSDLTSDSLDYSMSHKSSLHETIRAPTLRASELDATEPRSGSVV